MKTILTVVSFLVFAATTMAQTANDWQLVQSKSGVNIYAKEEVCTHITGVQAKFKHIKIENTTASVKTVNYRSGLYYGTNDCVTCPNSEYDVKITIAPNSSVASDCDGNNDKLKLFVRYENEKNYNPDLSKFEFVNLKVN